MRLFRSDPETNLASYILDELRELRKGQEGNNVEIRGEFAAIRDTITTLSEGVRAAQNQSGVMRSDLDEVVKRVETVEDTVSDIKRSAEIKDATTSSSWDGPKKILAVLGAIAVFFGAVVAISNGFPILASLAAYTLP